MFDAVLIVVLAAIVAFALFLWFRNQIRLTIKAAQQSTLDAMCCPDHKFHEFKAVNVDHAGLRQVCRRCGVEFDAVMKAIS